MQDGMVCAVGKLLVFADAIGLGDDGIEGVRGSSYGTIDELQLVVACRSI